MRNQVIGAILGKRAGCQPHIFYYASKTLNRAQGNYFTIERELLLVVYALIFFSFLLGA